MSIKVSPAPLMGPIWSLTPSSPSRRPQPQKTMAVATAAVPDFRKLRRVIMRFPPWLLFCRRGLPPPRCACFYPPRRVGPDGKIVGQAAGREQDGKTHLDHDP